MDNKKSEVQKNKKIKKTLMANGNQCECHIEMVVPEDKVNHVFDAAKSLALAGITFDTGFYSPKKNFFTIDWEFDFSLKGAKVFFRKKIIDS